MYEVRQDAARVEDSGKLDSREIVAFGHNLPLGLHSSNSPFDLDSTPSVNLVVSIDYATLYLERSCLLAVNPPHYVHLCANVACCS